MVWFDYSQQTLNHFQNTRGQLATAGWFERFFHKSFEVVENDDQQVVGWPSWLKRRLRHHCRVQRRSSLPPTRPSCTTTKRSRHIFLSVFYSTNECEYRFYKIRCHTSIPRWSTSSPWHMIGKTDTAGPPPGVKRPVQIWGFTWAVKVESPGAQPTARPCLVSSKWSTKLSAGTSALQ